jgi:REP element-mobilizing transposase RayT
VSYWRLFYHMIWSTLHREPLIDERVRAIVERSFRTTFEAVDAIPHAVFMMPDHVHVAVSLPPLASDHSALSLPTSTTNPSVMQTRDFGHNMKVTALCLIRGRGQFVVNPEGVFVH